VLFFFFGDVGLSRSYSRGNHVFINHVTCYDTRLSQKDVFKIPFDVQFARLRPHSGRPKQTHLTALRRGWRNPQDTRFSCPNSFAPLSTQNQVFGLCAVVYSCLNTDLKNSGLRLIVKSDYAALSRNIHTYPNRVFS
jgi:hypothetical protein